MEIRSAPAPVPVRVASPFDPGARALLEASRALMRRHFPPEEDFGLGLASLAAPEVTLWLAGDAEPVGCAALKRADGYGEVKSMFVADAARGRGVGRALLVAVEAAARAEGLPVLRLETGAPLVAALLLYRRAGFVPCAAFGAYPEGGASLFMEKAL